MMYQHDIERLRLADPKQLTNVELDDISNWNKDFFPLSIRSAAIGEIKRRDNTLADMAALKLRACNLQKAMDDAEIKNDGISWMAASIEHVEVLEKLQELNNV